MLIVEVGTRLQATVAFLGEIGRIETVGGDGSPTTLLVASGEAGGGTELHRYRVAASAVHLTGELDLGPGSVALAFAPSGNLVLYEPAGKAGQVWEAQLSPPGLTGARELFSAGQVLALAW